MTCNFKGKNKFKNEKCERFLDCDEKRIRLYMTWNNNSRICSVCRIVRDMQMFCVCQLDSRHFTGTSLIALFLTNGALIILIDKADFAKLCDIDCHLRIEQMKLRALTNSEA